MFADYLNDMYGQLCDIPLIILTQEALTVKIHLGGATKKNKSEIAKRLLLQNCLGNVH